MALEKPVVIAQPQSTLGRTYRPPPVTQPDVKLQHAPGNAFRSELDSYIRNHLAQTINRCTLILVVCRNSVGVHCRAEEQETYHCFLQFRALALLLVDPQNNVDLEHHIGAYHCEEEVSLRDERVALEVRRDDVNIRRGIYCG